jgi:hypothetical protein
MHTMMILSMDQGKGLTEDALHPVRFFELAERFWRGARHLCASARAVTFHCIQGRFLRRITFHDFNAEHF